MTAALATGALVACAPEPPRKPRPAPPSDFATPEAFDWVAERVVGPGGEETPSLTNDRGRLAWGTAYHLQARLAMFRATGDRRHLEALLERGEQVLAMRDDQRGVPDYQGLRRPVWSAAGSYTACWRDLVDEGGRPVLRVRSLAKGDEVSCSVRPGADGRGFDLAVRGAADDQVEELRGLSSDPASERYLVRQLLALAPTPLDLTAEDLRPAGAGEAVLQPDKGPMERYRYAFAVHTGMLVAPLAAAAVLIRGDAGLRSRYAGVATRFVDASEAAMQAHDADWTSYGDAAVYAFGRGAPVRGDGTPLPHNQYLAAARAHMHLARAVDDPVHRRRARSMLAVFWSDLSAGVSPVWPYYWSASASARGYTADSGISGYSPAQQPNRAVEDTSHGALDVECLVQGHRSGFGDRSSDLRRLASTFLQHVARRTSSGEPTSADVLAARSAAGSYDESVPRWAVLAPWDRRVWDFGRRLMNERPPLEPDQVTLTAVAALVSQR